VLCHIVVVAPCFFRHFVVILHRQSYDVDLKNSGDLRQF
jgi:hypothetical protein